MTETTTTTTQPRIVSTATPQRHPPFRRHLAPGDVPGVGPLYVTVEWTAEGRLTFSGVEGPRANGDAVGSCGQTGIDANLVLRAGWTVEQVATLRASWERWHLNDTRAGCEHQVGDEWDASQRLALVRLTWGERYHALRRRVEAGEATVDEYHHFATVAAPLVKRLTLRLDGGRVPADASLRAADVAAAIADGWVKVDDGRGVTSGSGVEHVPACRVYPHEHPAGLLTRPCGVCGYRYGTEWRRVEVPADVIAAMLALPTVGAETLPYAWQR